MTDNDDTITMPKIDARYPVAPTRHPIPADLQAEIAAMYTMVAAIEPLENHARQRVLLWVVDSLDITLSR